MGYPTYERITMLVKPDSYADTMTVVFRSTFYRIDVNRNGVRFEAVDLGDGAWLIYVGYEKNGKELLRALGSYVGATLPTPSVLFYFNTRANKLYSSTFHLTAVDCFDVEEFWPPTGFPALQNGGVYRGGSSRKRWPFKNKLKIKLALSGTGTRLLLSYWSRTGKLRTYGENVNFTPQQYDGPEGTTWAIMAPNPHMNAPTAEFLAQWQEDLNINLTRFRTNDGLIPFLYINDDGSKILFGGEEGFVTLWPHGRVPKSSRNTKN